MMASFFREVVGGIINAAGANLNPYTVQSCEPAKQVKGEIVETNGAVTLYKETGCYEAILYNSKFYPGKSFSLFRLYNKGDSCATFRSITSKLVPLCASSLKVYQEQVLQKICDAVRDHPTWTVGHVAAHVGIPDSFHDHHVASFINSMTTVTQLTPLMVAIMAGQEACVDLMLRQGAKINATDAAGDTAYHKAVLYCPNALQLLEKVDKYKVINWLNGSGQSALHLACMEDKANSVETLLELGADVNVTACDTRPIHAALRKDKITCAEKILHFHPEQVHCTDNKYNGTPAHWAKSKQALELCMEMGCDMNTVSQTGDTPLNIMLERGRLGCVFALLSHGVGVNIAGKDGNTPLHLAVQKDDIDLIKSLVVFGADVDARNSKNQTARHLVATSKSKNRDVILYMLHLVGAKRCDQTAKGCLQGCVAEGTFHGKPDQNMIDLLEQNNQAVEDALDEALACDVNSSAFGKHPRPQRVLCLDGGGIRGIVLIQMLLAIEKAAGQPIRDCFDWVSGTSTGGILAIAIAVAKPLQQVLGMYFGLKDKVFVGNRPYPSEPLERLLKKEMTDKLRMSDIKRPKLLVSGVLADRFPPVLHYFRNYIPPVVYRPASEGPVHGPPPPPSEQYVWQAARCSGAAPSYFRACGPFLDGGLMSNNPTLDTLTEIHEYNIGLKSLGQHGEAAPVGVMVSLGTGRSPTAPVKHQVDIAKPGGLFEAVTAVRGVFSLANILLDQATISEGRPNDRARAWCSMINVPYFRFSPQLSEDVPLDAHDDKTILNMMWETQCYITSKKQKISQLATLLRGGNSKLGMS